MAQRPTFIDLGSTSSMSSGVPAPFAQTSSGHSSPRIAHFDGEIPPAMSPLDAFAAQSRLLAKQLDDSQRQGRRVSRLPPQAIAKSFAKPRPGYFHSPPLGDHTLAPRAPKGNEEPSGTRTQVAEPEVRPKSIHPIRSGVPHAQDAYPEFSMPSTDDQAFFTPSESRPSTSSNDYFSSLRVGTPEPIAPSPHLTESPRHEPSLRYNRSFESRFQKADPHRNMSMESSTSQPRNLNLPGPHHTRQAASLRSNTIDSSDDEPSTSLSEASSQQRKLSSNSGMSSPHVPLSPFGGSSVRPPSIASEYSLGGSRLSRPAFNFSRPLSRDSRPSMESNRQNSTERQSTHITRNETSQTPQSIDNDEYFETKDEHVAPAASYIYAKFSLPRGRILQRDSEGLDDVEIPRFEWEQSMRETNVTPIRHDEPHDQPSSLPTPPRSVESEQKSPKSPPQVPADRASDELNPLRPSLPIARDVTGRQSLSSMNSGSTIKAPKSPRNLAASADISSEDHLQKGIDCHERGSLKESTYHLRIAARQGNPTAMLLYALACRHGWGMRPNQGEGVQWLRKAMDSTNLELGSDEQNTNPADASERKQRRAQFALSVYELGVSHMNGWGIEQDKTLALRCFEIAANWGDADAMAEAGFCYAQAVGCKKDLKKAAKYYRMAESRGMSMVGNSWIYKPKYADDGSDDKDRGRGTGTGVTTEKKPRDKSRTRTLFGRKKN
ncbi:hypothetical protein MMC09_004065 [Bachmanniomyces sp. S44760]|nr:hypothetical protein [Bachmanniomyces sp. S44760]